MPAKKTIEDRFSEDEIQRAVEFQMTIQIPCNLIRPNPNNARKHFPAVEALSLQRDIVDGGQEQPVIVKPIEWDGEHQFELIAGERRWRACTAARKHVQALVRVYKNLDAEMLAMVRENCNRADLNDLEYAALIMRLQSIKEFRKIPDVVTRMEAIGGLFGRSGAWASAFLPLLDLAPPLKARMQADVPRDKQLPKTLASRLGRIKDHQIQEQIVADAGGQQLDTKKANRLIDAYVSSAGVGEHRKGRKPYDGMRNFERALRIARSQVQGILEKEEQDPKTFDKMFDGKDQREMRDLMSRTIDLAGSWDKVANLVARQRLGLDKKQ